MCIRDRHRRAPAHSGELRQTTPRCTAARYGVRRTAAYYGVPRCTTTHNWHTAQRPPAYFCVLWRTTTYDGAAQ
eukprot:10276716-Alexandrium_andersonii.AAC.1